MFLKEAAGDGWIDGAPSTRLIVSKMNRTVIQDGAQTIVEQEFRSKQDVLWPRASGISFWQLDENTEDKRVLRNALIHTAHED